MAQNRQRCVERPSSKYLLRGLLWCGKCTRRCVSNPGRQTHGKHSPYYRCGNIEYKPYKRRCDAPGISVAAIEGAIWGLLKQPSVLLELGRAYYESIGKPEGDGTANLEQELKRLRAKVATTQAMMQDNLIAYAKGKADIRTCEERIRQVEEELLTAGRVVALPSLHAAKASLREITDAPEPTAYEGRREILEGLLDLRMTYYDGDLTIEGKVPVRSAAAGSGEKNRKGGVGADTQGQSEDYNGGEPGRPGQ